MKRILSAFLLLFAPLAYSQTTVTGTCSVVVPATSLPSGMTFASGVLTVPQISTGSILLTGGQAYPDGQYLVQITGGAITYVPYIPLTGTNPAPPTASLQAILSTPALSYTIGAYTVPIPGAVVPAVSATGVIVGNTVSVSPIGLSPTLTLVKWEGYVSAPGVVTVFIDAHQLPAPGAVPAMKWLVRLQ